MVTTYTKTELSTSGPNKGGGGVQSQRMEFWKHFTLSTDALFEKSALPR